MNLSFVWNQSPLVMQHYKNECRQHNYDQIFCFLSSIWTSWSMQILNDRGPKQSLGELYTSSLLKQIYSYQLIQCNFYFSKRIPTNLEQDHRFTPNFPVGLKDVMVDCVKTALRYKEVKLLLPLSVFRWMSFMTLTLAVSVLRC